MYDWLLIVKCQHEKMYDWLLIVKCQHEMNRSQMHVLSYDFSRSGRAF
jgi:hypothetical protein